MPELHDAHYVGRHLGVKTITVTNWAERPTAAFPMPVAYVVSAPGRKGGPLWTKGQLPKLRGWLAARLALSDPEAYWLQVDRNNTPKVPQGQMELEL